MSDQPVSPDSQTCQLVSQDSLEGILHIVDVEFIKFMFLGYRLEDAIQTSGVLGGDLAESGVACHPASTGSDL